MCVTSGCGDRERRSGGRAIDGMIYGRWLRSGDFGFGQRERERGRAIVDRMVLGDAFCLR